MSATCENKCPHTPCTCWGLDEKPEMTTDHNLIDQIYMECGCRNTDALRDIMELHKPEHSIRGYRCTFDDEVHPCKHWQTAEKRLG